MQYSLKGVYLCLFHIKHPLGSIVRFDNLTAHAIAAELGDRIKTVRLNVNLTQKALAKKAGVSLKAVTNAEKGKSTLESMVAILIALDMTAQLDSFIPKQQISPVQLMALQGKERKRASSPSTDTNQTEEPSKW